MRTRLCLLISILLHTILFYIVSVKPSALRAKLEQQQGEGKDKGNNKQETIVPKIVEVEIIEAPPVNDKSDVPMDTHKSDKHKKQKKIDGLEDCNGGNWFGGIGVSTIGLADVGAEIAEVYPGYPASEAGIEPGDYLQSISSDEGEHIRGPVGTAVIVVVFRPSINAVFTVTLIRAKICTR